MRKLMLAFSGFLLTAVASAQTPNFQVLVQDPDGVPLTGAMVTYRGKTQLTDAQGLVAFQKGDTGALFISMEGFQSQRYGLFFPKDWESSIDRVKRVTMIPELAQIGGPVLIRVEGKSTLSMRSQTVASERMKQYLVRNRNPADPSNLAEQIPGVHVVDGQINIRSGSGWSYGAGSRVAVLVDDLPMLSGDAGQAQWSFVPVEWIKELDVQKGAGSVLYGSGALNGVLNIKTMQPAAKQRAGINTFYGWYDQPKEPGLRWSSQRRKQQGFSAWSLQQKGKLGYRLGLNYFNDEGYRMEEFSERLRVSAGLVWNLSAKATFTLDGSVMNNNSGSFLLWESYALGYTSLDSGFNRTNSNRFSIDPRLILKTGNIMHSLSGRILGIDNRNTNNDPTSGDQSNANVLRYGEYRVQGKLGKRTSWTAGAVWSGANTRSPLFSGTQTAENKAAYTQAEYVGKKLNLSAGARYEHYRLNKRTDAQPVFRLGLNYKLLPFMNLRASWGQGYRFPTIAESFIKTSVGPVKVYPNPSLKPETGSNSEAGMRLFWGRKGGGIYTDISVFDMRYRNMMEFTFSQWSSDIGPGNLFGFGFMSVNVGNTRVRGAELSVGGDFYTGKLHWQVLGGYTWTSPQVEDPDFVYGLDSLGRKLTFRETRSDENNILKYRYRNMARLDVQAGFKQLEFGWSFRYNGPIENIDRAFVSLPINLFILDVDRARLDNSSGVYIMDARLAWRFRPKSASRLAVLVNNITNQVYMTRPADLRPPRSFQIQLLAEF